MLRVIKNKKIKCKQNCLYFCFLVEGDLIFGYLALFLCFKQRAVMIPANRKMLKYPALVIICFLSVTFSYSQGNSIYQNTEDINRKLKVLSRPTPDAPGGYIFDNSYEGLKGSPYLFDKFLPLQIKVKEVDFYLSVEGNIDLKNNTFIYIEKESGVLYSIPCQRVAELIVETGEERMIFRTTDTKNSQKGLNEERFYQVLKEAPYKFIKMPSKVLIPADYRGAYSAKRRYDEYKFEAKYYIVSFDTLYAEVKLKKNSLIKLFPDKKETIKKVIKEKTYSDPEEMVLSVLKKF